MASLFDLLPQFPTFGPPVPQGVRLSWGGLWKTISGEIGGLVGTLRPEGTNIILPDPVYLLFKSVTAAGHDALTNSDAVAKWVALIEARVVATGKFPQYAATYTNISPPPFFYDYKCLKCFAYGPNANLPENTCKWVAGPISPQSWCAIWCPKTGYAPFTWPQELVKGDW